MQIDEFGVEIWMNQYENHCQYNIAETCVDSLTVQELLDIAGRGTDALEELLPVRLTYGAIEGSDRLRTAITGLYTQQRLDNIVVTHGAAGANSLVHQTLVSRGDHVVTVVPTYQQHVAIPKSVGADVEQVSLRAQDGYALDVEALTAAVRPDTRLIALTNPNNPTGALLDRASLQAIADAAARVGAYVLCDEVYRGLHQDDDDMGPSIADLYERGISTASMSKTFSLAGLRLGWVAAPRDVIHQISVHRDYNTISVGMIDDHLATLALENKDAVLARSRAIVRRNLATLDAWVHGEPAVSYVRPKAGTTALLRYDRDVPSRDLAQDILQKTGVLFTPGSALGVEGTLRIGYASDHEVLQQGLAELTRYFAQD